ncbi:MAG TPA: HAD family hydrolase [Kofleriaceae bacterium]|jgi:HAD superfamily hydrolase (TIGR01490 family)
MIDRPAAFFDMDNTLLRVDSGMSWVRFLYRRGELPPRMVAKALYWQTLYRLALLDMDAVFTRLVEDLRGDSEADMIAKCEIWYRDHVAPEVAPAARVAIEHHRQAGHLIVLATGSTQYAARPVASGVGIEHVLSSELEVERGVFTGRPAAFCFGHHKVALAERWAERHGVDLAASYFYSDSYNDLPMLERVGTAIAVNPDARLRRHARRRGWATPRWS